MGGERAMLKNLLCELDLEGVLIQADALHTQKPFFHHLKEHIRSVVGTGHREPQPC